MSDNTEPVLSKYLHARAANEGIPLSGNFELTPRCNFDCRMCYVHLTPQQQKPIGRELTSSEWLSVASDAVKQGMIFLLLTGGEPLLRPDFPSIYRELKKLGLMVSVNTNGYLIDEDTVSLFCEVTPLRINISLYGRDDDEYERLCGVRGYTRVTENIRRLREKGINVKLNVSVTQYNVGSLERFYELARELDCPIQVSCYMYPPVRRAGAKAERLSPTEAAEAAVKSDILRLPREEFLLRAGNIKKGVGIRSENECAVMPGEGMQCRAGRSTFWITWDGRMTPCGLMDAPAAELKEKGFAECWKSIREETERIVLPPECTVCEYRFCCNVCAAVCRSETGSFSGRPEYVCEMTKRAAEITQWEYEGMTGREKK